MDHIVFDRLLDFVFGARRFSEIFFLKVDEVVVFNDHLSHGLQSYVLESERSIAHDFKQADVFWQRFSIGERCCYRAAGLVDHGLGLDDRDKRSEAVVLVSPYDKVEPWREEVESDGTGRTFTITLIKSDYFVSVLMK